MRNPSNPYFQALEETLKEARPSWEDMFLPDPPNMKKPELIGSCEVCGDPIPHGKLCNRCKFIVSHSPNGILARTRPDLLEAGGPLDKWEESIEDDLGDVSDLLPPLEVKVRNLTKAFVDAIDEFAERHEEGDAESGPYLSIDVNKKTIWRAADKVIQDFGIDYETIEWALQYARKHGIQPDWDEEPLNMMWIEQAVRELAKKRDIQTHEIYEGIEDEIGDTGDFEKPERRETVATEVLCKEGYNARVDFGNFNGGDCVIVTVYTIDEDELTDHMAEIENTLEQYSFEVRECLVFLGQNDADIEVYLAEPGSMREGALDDLGDVGEFDPRLPVDTLVEIVMPPDYQSAKGNWQVAGNRGWIDSWDGTYCFISSAPKNKAGETIAFVPGSWVVPLQEGALDDVGDVSNFPEPISRYKGAIKILTDAGFDAEIKHHPGKPAQKEDYQFGGAVSYPAQPAYDYIYIKDILRPAEIRDLLHNSGFKVYGMDQQSYFKDTEPRGWVFAVALTLRDPDKPTEYLQEGWKESQYREAFNETRRWHEGEPTLGDMRKNNAETALSPEPVDDSEPIPPPPGEESTIPAANDMGDVGDFENPGAWTPEEQAVLDKFHELYPELGTAGAIVKISQDMGFPYAAAHAIISSYLNKFNTDEGEDIPHTEEIIPQGIFESVEDEGFGKSETGPLGREEEDPEIYNDLDDVSDFDNPAGRYGTPLDIKVTHIGAEYHARLFANGKLVDEKACKNKEDIGWMCREMMRWYSKMGGDSAHAENARDRHNEEPSDRSDVRQVNINEAIEDDIGDIGDFDSPAVRLDQEFYRKYLQWLNDDEFEYLAQLIGEDQFEAMTNQEIVRAMPDYMLDDIEQRRSVARKQRQRESVMDPTDRHNEEPSDRPGVRQISINEAIEDNMGDVGDFETPDLAWCRKLVLDRMNKNNTYYSFDKNGFCNVKGDVNLSGLEIREFGMQFGVVTGNFDCDDCPSLTTLEGGPQEIGGDFYCSGCTSLTTLEGAPQKVGGGGFYCSGCTSLTTLEGGPQEVGGNFYCNSCTSLTTLKGAPQKVGGIFCHNNCPSLRITESIEDNMGDVGDFEKPDLAWCRKLVLDRMNKSDIQYSFDKNGFCNVEGDVDLSGLEIREFGMQFGVVTGDFYCNDCTSLTTLGGASQKVGRGFYCNGCTSLTTLEGAPQEVGGGGFRCSRCASLITLEGAPQIVGGSFYCNGCTSLTTLEGAPQKVGRDFYCSGCTSLTTLEDAPQERGGIFCHNNCPSLRIAESIEDNIGDVGDFETPDLAWCRKLVLDRMNKSDIQYSFDKNGFCNVEGDVDLSNLRIREFGMQFGVVTGNFDCSNCTSLTTLEGAPQKVGRGFYCSGCTSLTTLEGAPQKVGGEIFYCSRCTSLTTLEGAPQIVGGNFYCNGCTSLATLKGGPQEVYGGFYCNDCTSLTTLEGAPQEVGGDFYCNGCTSLTTLEDVPQIIGGSFSCGA